MAGLVNNERYSLYYQRLNLIYQRPEIKASLEVILSVFTVLLLIFAAIRPTLINVTSLQKKIVDQESLNKKADNKIAQLFNLQTQMETYKDQLVLYDNAVPDLFSYHDMTARIEFLAKKNSVTVSALSMPGVLTFGKGSSKGSWIGKLAIQNGNNITLTDVQFTLIGQPKNIIQMLGEIENLDNLVLIKNLLLTTELNGNNANTLKASGMMEFYFYKAKQ